MSFLSSNEPIKTFYHGILDKKFLIIVICLGTALRLLAATRGHNFDFESYLIVARILDQGGNVYAETTRYNYGPVWSYILWLLYSASLKNEFTFHYFIATFLTLVDIGIFIILWKKFGSTMAYIFFLCPVGIIISGYHNQFDNFAILLALFAMLLLEDTLNKPFTKKSYLGLTTLGFSLATKHIFFLFPFWLAVKENKLSNKVITILLPSFVFLIGFLPFWNTGKSGIINNVFLYKSWENGYFYELFIPANIQTLISRQDIWLIILLLCAFLFKNTNLIESLLFYTCVLVATSPAITNQYLAIVIPFLAVNFNLISFFYIVVATFHLAMDNDGLKFIQLSNIFNHNRDAYYLTLIILLCVAFIWVSWKKIKKSGNRKFIDVANGVRKETQ